MKSWVAATITSPPFNEIAPGTFADRPRSHTGLPVAGSSSTIGFVRAVTPGSAEPVDAKPPVSATATLVHTPPPLLPAGTPYHVARLAPVAVSNSLTPPRMNGVAQFEEKPR